MRFKARIVNGLPVVLAEALRTKNKNGGYDITIQAPSLQLINDFIERNKNGKRDLQSV